MKKTIVQMMATVLVLWGAFAASEWVFEAQPHAVSATVENGAKVPIIMYHSILKDPATAGTYTLSPAALESDLSYLKQRGYETITVSDLLTYVQEGTPLPSKPVMITFDDGFYNNYVYAYPLLKEKNMKAVISIIGNQTRIFTENGEENAYWSYLTSARCKEMIASDTIEIQNHSYDLHTIGNRRGCLRERGEDETGYQEFLKDDAMKTQQLLEQSELPAPKCYTYPFGYASKESEAVLKTVGFQCTLGCEEGMNLVTRDPDSLFLMKRYNRPSGISTDAFMKRAGIE